MQNQKTIALRTFLLAGVAAMAAGPVWAQAEEEDAPREVVVIGSYIEGFGDSGALPVTVLEREDLDLYGSVSTGDLLANIPAIGDLEFTDNNTGTNGARGDVTGINLRGLGSGRTLVLLNGRRVVGHPQSEAVDSVPVTFFNVNAIPSPLIGRVEVLRDGASALYGADAVAGVVNLNLQSDYEGLFGSARYGVNSETGLEESALAARFGHIFNGGATSLTLGGSFFHRTDVRYTDLPEWFGTLDRRDLLPADWLGDTQFDNRSTLGPYGRFVVGALDADGVFQGIRVRQNGTSLTASNGGFHLQPAGLSGALADLGGGIFLDDSSTQDRDLRYDFIRDEKITPEVDRLNFAANLTHDLGNGVEFFGDALYYHSKSETQRAPGPFDASLAYIIVPASNYYNPFGPVGSPNRLPDIDAPAEGLDVLMVGYRPLELGPRVIEVEQDLYRLLGGFRGEWSGWDWETALGYSQATARDEEFNRQSKTLLQNQLALSTPDAFNPFGGPFANSEDVLSQIRISSVRYGESSLLTWDARLTRGDLFSLPGGDVGAAFGIEFRQEEVTEDSDPRLDGTLTFTNGAVPDESDLVGVSATRDFSGDRDVWSAYGELTIPIVGEANSFPLVHALDLQLASRFEDSSDYGDTFKPKAALHWFLHPALSVRGSYAEGFRAPNLVQLNQGTITRRNQGNEDPYRVGVTDTAGDIGDTYRPSIREGNPNLEAEESTTFNVGVVFDPEMGQAGDFRFAVDYWTVETENAITTLGVQRLLDDDFASRAAGGPGIANVVRAPVSPDDIAAFDAYNLANPSAQRTPAGEVLFVIDGYINLDQREVEGFDVSASYETPEFGWGSLTFRADATKLIAFDETRSEGVFDELRRNGNPEWRGNGSVSWEKGPWSAAAQLRYVGDVFDTSATNDTTGAFWEVEDWYSVNALVGYEFGENANALSGVDMRVGVRNLFDELPPYADESPGFLSGLYSIEGRVVYGQISKEF